MLTENKIKSFERTEFMNWGKTKIRNVCADMKKKVGKNV